MRLFAILVALVVVQYQSAELWYYFGSLSDPWTWAIWLTPAPVIGWDENLVRTRSSRFFQRITNRE